MTFVLSSGQDNGAYAFTYTYGFTVAVHIWTYTHGLTAAANHSWLYRKFKNKRTCTYTYVLTAAHNVHRTTNQVVT